MRNTTINQIAKYWTENGPNESELNFDWSEAKTHCWNCGDDKSTNENNYDGARLEKAHIIPDSLGGEDVASNYVLLCNECHKEAPNPSNPKHMWNWIKENRTPLGLYGTYRIQKGLDLFEARKGYSFIKFMADKLNSDTNATFKSEFEKVSTHGGYKVNKETYYNIFCDIAEKYTK